MKAILLLAFSALAWIPNAKADLEALMPPAKIVTTPNASVRLLKVFRIGPRLGIYRVPLKGCAASVLAVNIKVNKANVNLQAIGVRFTDGTYRKFAVTRTFLAGDESGWIDLGTFRAIDSRCPLEVLAYAHSSGGSAQALVYGNLH